MLVKNLGVGVVLAVLAASGVAVLSCGSSTEDASARAPGRGPQALSVVNLVANPSLETVNTARPSEPASWKPASWGTNTATFKYDATDANTGTRSVRIDVPTWSSGDAKWIFDAIPVAPGSALIYRDYYKSTVTTKLVAAYTLAGGTTSFVTLATVPARAGWSTVAAALTAPSGATGVTVYHLIAAAGTLQLDDVSLSPPQTPDLSSGVPNGSLEQASDLDLNQPLAWHSGGYGTNVATFAYATGGHTGSRSVTVTVSGYVNGDAKWYYDPQPVVPGTRYLVSDYYLASTASFLAVRLTMSDGSFTYINLGQVPAASTFTPARFAFLAPAGAAQATVFHGLATNGTLQLDDAALSVLPPTPLVNGVPNGDLEQPAFPGSSLPAAWHPNVWGTNTTAFSYLAGGTSGSYVRTDVVAYTSGAASWYFDPIPVVAGQPYRATVSYRSSASIMIQALVTRSDGTSIYIQLPTVDAAASWTTYSAKIYLPLNATAITLYYKLSQVGFVELDNSGLLPTTTMPFQRGLVSLSFDDSWDTDFTKALPLLTQYQVPATHFVITGLTGNPGRLTLDMLATLAARGDEIASHTVTHPDLTTLSAADLQTELVSSKQFLEANGFGPALDFASPYGLYNGTVVSAIQPSYQSHRTVDVGYNSKDDLDVYRLKVQNMFSTTTASDVEGWVAQAAADRSWLILVYHDVADAPTGSVYTTTTANLNAQLTVLQRYGLPVVTVRQALNELVPQLVTP